MKDLEGFRDWMIFLLGLIIFLLAGISWRLHEVVQLLTVLARN